MCVQKGAVCSAVQQVGDRRPAHHLHHCHQLEEGKGKGKGEGLCVSVSPSSVRRRQIPVGEVDGKGNPV